MLLSGKKLFKQGETEQLLIYILQYRISKANIVTQIVNPTTKMEPNRGFPPPRQTILFSQFPPKKYFEFWLFIAHKVQKFYLIFCHNFKHYVSKTIRTTPLPF